MRFLEASPGGVLVVGGGPAGLAAAIAVRLRGFDVAVADARWPPIDKTCGEGILWEGVEALRRLGIPLEACGGFPFRGIRFREGAASRELALPFMRGIGLRRTRLHELLAARAESLGVKLHWGTTVPAVAGLPARWIIGADGQNSRIRREAGLDSGSVVSRRFGFRRHYRVRPWSDLVEVYWGRDSQIYVTPVSSSEIGVALLSRDSHVRLDSALVEHPALLRRLRAAPLASPEQGGSTITRRLRRVAGGRTALVGDASGSVDAITGEGLSLSFAQAFLLADALAAGDLGLYQTRHRLQSRRARWTSRLLLLLDRVPRLRRAIFRGLLR